jgi:hypothetical protein
MAEWQGCQRIWDSASGAHGHTGNMPPRLLLALAIPVPLLKIPRFKNFYDWFAKNCDKIDASD